METIKLRAHIDSDGVLKLEMPTNFKNIDADVIVVLQPASEQETDALGWPIGYFEEVYGILADDPIERGAQGEFEEREPIE
jgi:hypothetical protein